MKVGLHVLFLSEGSILLHMPHDNFGQIQSSWFSKWRNSKTIIYEMSPKNEQFFVLNKKKSSEISVTVHYMFMFLVFNLSWHGVICMLTEPFTTMQYWTVYHNIYNFYSWQKRPTDTYTHTKARNHAWTVAKDLQD